MTYLALPQIWYRIREMFFIRWKEPLTVLHEELKNKYTEALKHNLVSIDGNLK